METPPIEKKTIVDRSYVYGNVTIHINYDFVSLRIEYASGMIVVTPITPLQCRELVSGEICWGIEIQFLGVAEHVVFNSALPEKPSWSFWEQIIFCTGNFQILQDPEIRLDNGQRTSYAKRFEIPPIHVEDDSPPAESIGDRILSTINTSRLIRTQAARIKP